jgi:hypothetical protein
MELLGFLHVLGAVAVLTAVAGACVHAANGGERRGNVARVALTISHGIGLLLVLAAGFMMVAQLGGGGPHGWLGVKLVLWLFLGAAIMLPYRRRALAIPLLLILPVLAAIAAYLGTQQPF